jgi:arginyl-tRNA synthetase
MKQQIEHNLVTAAHQFLSERGLPVDSLPAFEVEYAKDERHGDYASNIAMLLAKPAGMAPRKIAEIIIQTLPAIPYLEKTEIAGPGFINFFVSSNAWLQIIPDILQRSVEFGRSDNGQHRKILLEYVSANPTGPIHIGHGRGAAYGSVIATLLKTAGYDVTTEYYVNDAGRQMDILAISVWIRYLQHQNKDITSFPTNAYQGKYVEEIASAFYRISPDLPRPDKARLDKIQASTDDDDTKLDQIITLAKSTLGPQAYEELFSHALNEILVEIRTDLAEFGVNFDNWFSERSLIENGTVENCIKRLEKSGHIYTQDGAKWFRSTQFGDEKDRVVVRENGQSTYFASDIAYHLEKIERGFDEIIDIWGADHHGYIARVKGAITALDQDAEKLKILLVQFATLYRGKQKLQMSTRSGEFVTLKELRDEVGNDATRFFYVMRKSEQHLDFDLDLAKSQSNENPVYYVQYAHARICSVIKQMRERGFLFDQSIALANLPMLSEQQERALVKTLCRYTEVISTAARSQESHLLAFYLRELANDFHAYYNACQFLVDDVPLRQARLSLIMATRQVINNGLAILGVSAPEEM